MFSAAAQALSMIYLPLLVVGLPAGSGCVGVVIRVRDRVWARRCPQKRAENGLILGGKRQFRRKGGTFGRKSDFEWLKV